VTYHPVCVLAFPLLLMIQLQAASNPSGPVCVCARVCGGGWEPGQCVDMHGGMVGGRAEAAYQEQCSSSSSFIITTAAIRFGNHHHHALRRAELADCLVRDG
jgi:hypothetical protein